MRKIVGITVVLIMLVSLIACSKVPATNDSTSTITVYASFYPLYDITQKIAGEHATIINLLPSGAEPHDWEPGPQTVASLLQADLLVVNGLGMEPWLHKLGESLEGQVPIVITSAGIEPLYGYEDHHDEEEKHHDEEEKHDDEARTQIPDPHIWLDPQYALLQAESIATALQEIDPVHAHIYQENLANFSVQIEKLDQDFRETLQSVQRREFVVTHLSFAYLAARYGLEQKAISGLTAHAEPSPAEMSELVDFMREHNIRYIFQEPLVSGRLAQTIASEVGAELLILNPLAGLTEEEEAAGEDYFSVMRQNLNQLAYALQD